MKLTLRTYTLFQKDFTYLEAQHSDKSNAFSKMWVLPLLWHLEVEEKIEGILSFISH